MYIQSQVKDTNQITQVVVVVVQPKIVLKVTEKVSKSHTRKDEDESTRLENNIVKANTINSNVIIYIKKITNFLSYTNIQTYNRR